MSHGRAPLSSLRIAVADVAMSGTPTTAPSDADASAGDGYEVLAPECGHGVAGMVRRELLRHLEATRGPLAMASVVVTDPMCDRPGLRIRAPDRAAVVAAIDGASALLDRWERLLTEKEEGATA